jgi:hypothetical protein
MKNLAFLVCAAAAFLSWGACAAEDEIPWDTIKDTAQRYLEKCVDKSDRDSMSRKMDQRIKQRCDDTGCDADQAAREIMFDWAAENQNNLKKHEAKAVSQVCFYFVSFMDRGFLISTQIRNSLTPSLVKKIIDFLDEEIKKKK